MLDPKWFLDQPWDGREGILDQLDRRSSSIGQNIVRNLWCIDRGLPGAASWKGARFPDRSLNMTFESRVPRRDTQVTDTSDSRGGPAIDHGKNRAPRRTFRRWRGIFGKDTLPLRRRKRGVRIDTTGRKEGRWPSVWIFETSLHEGDEVILGCCRCWCGEWTEERRILDRRVDGGIVWMEVREPGFIGLWLCHRRMGIARRAKMVDCKALGWYPVNNPCLPPIIGETGLEESVSFVEDTVSCSSRESRLDQWCQLSTNRDCELLDIDQQ